jgi:hypothetical protein
MGGNHFPGVELSGFQSLEVSFVVQIDLNAGNRGLIAIRKNTAQPSGELLKRGDLFDIILIQIKGGLARGPT